MTRTKFHVQLVAAMTVFFVVALGLVASADVLVYDADVVTAGNQPGPVNLGTVSPGAVISKAVSLQLQCAGKAHVDEGQTVALAYNSVGSTVPSGGSLSATSASIGAVPESWADDTSGGGSTNCPSPAPLLDDNGNSTVTITAPTTPGSYTYVAAFSNSLSPSGNGDPQAITGGGPSVTYNLMVEAPSDTTPPALTLPADITAEATSSSGATVAFTTSASDLVDGSVAVSCTPASGSTFSLGTTAVSCSASDTSDNTTTGSFNVAVQDTTPPTITGLGNLSIEAAGPSGATATYTPTAIDIVDGSVAVTCTPTSGSTFSLVETTVHCSATDAHGNAGTGAFTVLITDLTGPALTLPADITAEATSSSGATVAFTTSASDLVDGSVAVSCTPASGSTFSLGTTAVSCSASDTRSNTTTGSFNVAVEDTTPPAVTVPADITAEATGASGGAVTFSASATDIVDGTVAVSCTPASGSTFALGTTAVSCSASDTRSNTATGSFNVTVQDTTPPTVTVSADKTVEATGPGGAAVSFAGEVSANDLVSGAVAATCLPASGHTFPLGVTTVTCSATDAAGNTGSSWFTITVVDTIAPTITFASALPAPNGTGWNNSDVTLTWSCTDLVGVTSATVSQVISSEGPNQSATGTCTDTSGNTASDTHSGVKLDKTPPTLVPTVSPDPVVLGAAATASANAIDALSGVASSSCDPVDTSTIGSHSVACNARDNAGNENSANATFGVVYNWTGFFKPVDGGGVFNVAKAGQAIPVKFNLGGNQGLNIFNAGYPKSQKVSCEASAPQDVIEETITAGNSSLTYDSSANQYIYVWKTDKVWANTCRVFYLGLKDGTTHPAYFKFTK